MKTTIYWIRHAETESNYKHTFSGSINTDLSSRGLIQLDYLAKRFESIPFAALYSSPLTRARRTAEAAGRGHNLELQLDPRLLEVDGGRFEGLTWDEIERDFPSEYALWSKQPHLFCAPDGDRMVDVCQRICAAADEIVRRHAGQSVCIVSHGGALRNYLCIAGGHEHSHLKDTNWVDNTSVSMVEYDDAFRPHIVYQNDTTHLPPDLVTPKRTQEERK